MPSICHLSEWVTGTKGGKVTYARRDKEPCRTAQHGWGASKGQLQEMLLESPDPWHELFPCISFSGQA